MHKFAFFLLFLMKIGILHFCEWIKNKGGSPTSKYAFCHKHRVSVIFRIEGVLYMAVYRSKPDWFRSKS